MNGRAVILSATNGFTISSMDPTGTYFGDKYAATVLVIPSLTQAPITNILLTYGSNYASYYGIDTFGYTPGSQIQSTDVLTITFNSVGTSLFVTPSVTTVSCTRGDTGAAMVCTAIYASGFLSSL